MAAKPTALARPLRLVLIWNGEPLEERVLYAAEPVVLGSTANVTFAAPDSLVGGAYTLLRPSPDGSFTLCLRPGMSGTLCIDRREISVEEYLGQARGLTEQPLTMSDWGVVSLDDSETIAVFFQFLSPQVGIGTAPAFMDRFIGQALVFSAVVHVTLLVIAFLVWEPEDMLDVDPPPSTAIAKLLMEPPPEPEKKEKPDVRKAREDDASKKAAKKEGKIGDKDAKPKGCSHARFAMRLDAFTNYGQVSAAIVDQSGEAEANHDVIDTRERSYASSQPIGVVNEVFFWLARSFGKKSSLRNLYMPGLGMDDCLA